jgi:formylglycine-generating enzyme required for sulfatase activity
LLTSTSSTEPAKSESPENDNYTAFTHELLVILEQGIENAGKILTLQDIFSGLKEQLASKNLPLPQISSHGSPNELEICKNQAYQKISPEEYSEELENTQVLEKPAQVPKKSHSSLQLIFGTTSIILLVGLLFYINLYTPEPNKKTALPGTNEETALPEPGSKETAGKIFQDRLKDGSLGPEMVWIPMGTFKMGDIQGGGDDNEQPVHQVSVKKFAMGRYEITVGEFRQFVNATGYQTDAEKEGDCYTWVGDDSGKNWRHLGFTQNDNHPLVCVSWNDINAYTRWLSEQTEQNYRLPTEAEWEYAARAGTNTKYWWGNKIGANKANCNSDCKDNFEYTAPVGSFMANAFGLYDTVGNVWEWTCSEYENTYQGKEKRCVSNAGFFALRGGSWYNNARRTRAADRDRLEPAVRSDNLGARLARQ